MEYSFLEIAQRIVDHRKERKMTQERFIEELYNQGVSIGRNRLSNIENGEGKAFSLDFLLACCKIFNTDIGHLMGEYEQKNRDFAFVCEFTGLSERAVDAMTFYRNSYAIEQLGKLLQDKEFWEMLSLFESHKNMAPEIMQKNKETVDLMYRAAKDAENKALSERYDQAAIYLDELRYRYNTDKRRCHVILDNIVNRFLPNI